jgi:Mrp family chromosome partitioning ATPase/capsular polysaccharide biosynthesis protein
MHENAATDRIDLREYLRPLWSYSWLIIALVVVATAGTYYYYDQKPRTYGASTTLFVENSGADQAFGTMGNQQDRNLMNQVFLLKSRRVAKRAAEILKVKADPGALLAVVNATPVENADFIRLNSTWSDPRGAARIADAYAQAFMDVQSGDLAKKAHKARIEAERQLAQIQKNSAQPGSNAESELTVKIQNLKQVEQLPGAGLSQTDPAVASPAPLSPKPKQNAMFAFALALALGVLAAYALARFDRRIKDPQTLERAYGVPVLADIPRASKRDLDVRSTQIPAPMTEGFRRLRANIELVAPDDGRTIIVTSAVPGEGKSTMVRNLALAYHEAGASVVVIEADLREPSLAKMLGVMPEPGLTNVIEGQEPLELTIQSVVEWPEQDPSANGNGNGPEEQWIPDHARPVAGQLDVLVRGPKPRNLTAIFAQGAIDTVVRTLACRYDVVLIDSPPLGAVSDATPLLSSVDGVLLVTRLGVTTEDAARRLASVTARASDARILGVVVNAVKERPLADYYAYYATTH